MWEGSDIQPSYILSSKLISSWCGQRVGLSMSLHVYAVMTIGSTVNNKLSSILNRFCYYIKNWAYISLKKTLWVENRSTFILSLRHFFSSVWNKWMTSMIDNKNNNNIIMVIKSSAQPIYTWEKREIKGKKTQPINCNLPIIRNNNYIRITTLFK